MLTSEAISILLSFTRKLSDLRLEEIKKEGSSYFQILGDLFQFVSEMKPSMTSSSFKGIICNLPIGVVNPFAIGDSLHQLAKIHEIEKRYGYLFFIQAVRTIK